MIVVVVACRISSVLSAEPHRFTPSDRSPHREGAASKMVRLDGAHDSARPHSLSCTSPPGRGRRVVVTTRGCMKTEEFAHRHSRRHCTPATRQGLRQYVDRVRAQVGWGHSRTQLVQSTPGLVVVGEAASVEQCVGMQFHLWRQISGVAMQENGHCSSWKCCSCGSVWWTERRA